MRPIDADELEKEIQELKKSPWYNGENGSYERFIRAEAIGIVTDLCVKDAPTLDLAPKWISVKDRLPEEKQSVLVHYVDGWMPIAFLLDGKWYQSGGETSWLSVTHWMPLPEPPKEG